MFTQYPRMSTFIDRHYGHVIKGDLKTIKGKSLYNIMSRGAKLRIEEDVNKP